MVIKKKYKLSTIIILLLLFFFWGGSAINKKLEWKIVEDLIAGSAFPVEMGNINSTVAQCVPSCYDPIASCCAPPCSEVVPSRGDYEATCPLYSFVSGQSTGGTGGNTAIFSNIAMGQAGLTSGGQFIYGGTTNNMSLGEQNAVLASVDGCYNCYAKNKSNWKQKFAVVADMFMAMFKD
ncbi:MAG: hypothetical protein U9Q85_02960 [Patescibacteria group bacterium]|nr:hypothetical protein [Patescibacteria group bacterium]